MSGYNKIARLVFVRVNGAAPYICAHCHSELITLEVVHHKDENNRNNDPSNLASMHKGCHNVHHGIGQNHSPEVIERIRQHHIGAKRSDEAREKMRAAWVGRSGKPHTDEAKKKISEAQKRRWELVHRNRGT